MLKNRKKMFLYNMYSYQIYLIYTAYGEPDTRAQDTTALDTTAQETTAQDTTAQDTTAQDTAAHFSK